MDTLFFLCNRKQENGLRKQIEPLSDFPLRCCGILGEIVLLRQNKIATNTSENMSRQACFSAGKRSKAAFTFNFNKHDTVF